MVSPSVTCSTVAPASAGTPACVPPQASGKVRSSAQARMRIHMPPRSVAPEPDNAKLAERLEAFAALLELAGSSYYTARAHRRGAELVRAPPASVAGLVRAGRVRELRGIGPGIERRLQELVETGRIAELDELEREVSPDLIGLGRFLGLGARRAVEIGRALGIRTADELREAAAGGRLRSVPG